MKKNFLCLWRLPAFILFLSVLLSSLIAHSQDPATAQKEYECRINKIRIIELEKKLSVINADLSASLTQQEIEDQRTEMTRLRSMKNPDSLQWPLFAGIAAKNNFKLRNCDASPQATLQCLADLEKKIKSKIDKALSLNKPELLDKKNEADTLLASYRSNIIAWRCDQPADNDVEILADIHGTWKSNKDVFYSIIQTGSVFTWSIAELHEKAEGTINGIKVSVKWTGDRGAGSTTGVVTLIDETGKATRIEWNNGLIFTRN